MQEIQKKIEYITYFDSFDQKELRKKILKKGNIIEVYSPYSFGIVKNVMQQQN